jgi:hypothetical protein
MRLLIDECLPRALKRLLTGYTSRTVQEMGWSGRLGENYRPCKAGAFITEFLARWSVSARRFELEIDLVERGMGTIVVHFLVHSLRTYPRNEPPFLCVPLLTPIIRSGLQFDGRLTARKQSCCRRSTRRARLTRFSLIWASSTTPWRALNRKTATKRGSSTDQAWARQPA